jgi:hypothetical protein
MSVLPITFKIAQCVRKSHNQRSGLVVLTEFEKGLAPYESFLKFMG